MPIKNYDSDEKFWPTFLVAPHLNQSESYQRQCPETMVKAIGFLSGSLTKDHKCIFEYKGSYYNPITSSNPMSIQKANFENF